MRHMLRGVALVLIGIVSTDGAASQEYRSNNKWPDVPCEALTKNPDGSWSIKGTLILPSNSRITNLTLADSDETKLWDQKCGDRR